MKLTTLRRSSHKHSSLRRGFLELQIVLFLRKNKADGDWRVELFLIFKRPSVFAMF